MTWNSPYTFAQPRGAHPPTPGQTPTTAHFPETPKYSTNLENRTGWTPTFAEEYTVFASTPGRITGGSQRSFADASGNVEADIAAHVSASAPMMPRTHPGSATSVAAPGSYTPQPRKKLDEAFSAQTATPPNTAIKATRKLAPKLSSETMQSARENHYRVVNTPTQTQVVSFPPTSTDMFGYPMSAPATAPIFPTTKPFWDSDAGMTGLSMGLSAEPPHAYGWNENPAAAQDGVKFPPPPSHEHARRRPRPLAPKAPVSASRSAYPFTTTHDDGDPFVAPMHALDPGLLFTRHGSTLGDHARSRGAVSGNHILREPYQHQTRELRREQEERRRVSVSKDSKHASERRILSSPALSEQPSRRVRSTRAQQTPDRLGEDGTSPLKRLSAIPEMRSSPRTTEVRMTVDPRGRARMETVRLADAAPSSTGQPDEWDSSSCDTSSDEEEIILPSRNPSLTRPSPAKAAKLTRYDTPRRHTTLMSYSRSGSSSSNALDEVESEAETLHGGDEHSGDATHELKKVMADRERERKTPRTHRYMMHGGQGSPGMSTRLRTLAPLSPRAGSTRCVCQNPHNVGFMIQCESCDFWLHAQCVNMDRHGLPPVYICAFCAQTRRARGIRIPPSPLAHKSLSRTYRPAC